MKVACGSQSPPKQMACRWLVGGLHVACTRNDIPQKSIDTRRGPKYNCAHKSESVLALELNMMPNNQEHTSRSDGRNVAGIRDAVWSPTIAQSRSAARDPIALSFIIAACLLSGCKSATVTGEHSFSAAPTAKPTVIYVTDFELGAQNIHHQEGILPEGSRLPSRVRGIISGETKDPAARARQLVDLMASSLTKDLTKAGFSALRLQPGTALPTDGWLVRGVVTEVQEGNRLQRSMIGLGQGATDLQVVTDVEDLSHGPPKPLYEVETDASSGKTPGAAPTIVLGPYGAAARFVMSKNDLEKNVTQTASQIADYVAKRVQEAK